MIPLFQERWYTMIPLWKIPALPRLLLRNVFTTMQCLWMTVLVLQLTIELYEYLTILLLRIVWISNYLTPVFISINLVFISIIYGLALTFMRLSTKASMGRSMNYSSPFNQQIAILSYQHAISLCRQGNDTYFLVKGGRNENKWTNKGIVRYNEVITVPVFGSCYEQVQCSAA